MNMEHMFSWRGERAIVLLQPPPVVRELVVAQYPNPLFVGYGLPELKAKIQGIGFGVHAWSFVEV